MPVASTPDYRSEGLVLRSRLAHYSDLAPRCRPPMIPTATGWYTIRGHSRNACMYVYVRATTEAKVLGGGRPGSHVQCEGHAMRPHAP